MMRGSELFTGAASDGLGQTPSDDELAVHPDPAAVTVTVLVAIWVRQVVFVDLARIGALLHNVG